MNPYYCMWSEDNSNEISKLTITDSKEITYKLSIDRFNDSFSDSFQVCFLIIRKEKNTFYLDVKSDNKVMRQTGEKILLSILSFINITSLSWLQ